MWEEFLALTLDKQAVIVIPLAGLIGGAIWQTYSFFSRTEIKFKDHKIQITVAIIGLVGVIAAALISNWDKIQIIELTDSGQELLRFIGVFGTITGVFVAIVALYLKHKRISNNFKDLINSVKKIGSRPVIISSLIMAIAIITAAFISNVDNFPWAIGWWESFDSLWSKTGIILFIVTIFISFLVLFTGKSTLEDIKTKILTEVVKAPPEEKKAKTVVGLMLGEKMKKSFQAQLFLILALTISLFSYILFQTAWNIVAIGIIIFSLLAIQIDKMLIEYRVKNGWYGTNEYEAREIISFIISHANKDDFNDSGGLKKVIPEPEIIEAEEPLTNPNGVPV